MLNLTKSFLEALLRTGIKHQSTHPSADFDRGTATLFGNLVWGQEPMMQAPTGVVVLI